MNDIFKHAKRKFCTCLFLTLLASSFLNGQVSNPYFYRVYFTDKGVNDVNASGTTRLVSERAVRRREKAGINFPVMSDLPVWQEYLDEIISGGLVLHCTSRWMNTALFSSSSSKEAIIRSFPFVKDVKLVKSPGKGAVADKLYFETYTALQQYDRPITMVNGQALHDAGFNGEGILIAVLDGGFANTDNVSSLGHLRNRKGIIATHDFVKKSPFIYSYSTHGTAVMSILAGRLPDELAGTAPGADYLLLRTENPDSEFPCEEDFWAAGAEYADSAGADIISSSLGYYFFDDASMNYKLSDLDGNTAFVTNAADMAASKGILVVNSAGNERMNTWKKIIFPSDGDSVLAAGAVDSRNLIAPFSSAGPSSDRRIKPDNDAMGVAIPINVSAANVTLSNGTSFSCPVLSGMAACLMQAVPEATAADVLEAFHLSADRFSFPDSLYGYGIPDMGKAFVQLQDKYTMIPFDEVMVYPNPSSGEFSILFRQAPGAVFVEIISLTGKIILQKDMPAFTGREIRVTGLQRNEQGICFIRIKTDKSTIVKKMIRIRQ